MEPLAQLSKLFQKSDLTDELCVSLDRVKSINGTFVKNQINER